MPTDNEAYRRVINQPVVCVAECLEASNAAHAAGAQLYTDWEIDFVESVDKQLGAGRFLSDKQIQIVCRLMRKAHESDY